MLKIYYDICIKIKYFINYKKDLLHNRNIKNCPKNISEI